MKKIFSLAIIAIIFTGVSNTAFARGKKIGNELMSKITSEQNACTKPTQKQIESNHPNEKPISTIF